MQVLVIFMALAYLLREVLHGGWVERVGVDGGLDGRVVVDCSLFGRAVGDGCDGGRVSTMLGCCFDVRALLFCGDVSETGEEGVDVGQNAGHVADGLEVRRSWCRHGHARWGEVLNTRAAGARSETAGEAGTAGMGESG